MSKIVKYLNIYTYIYNFDPDLYQARSILYHEGFVLRIRVGDPWVAQQFGTCLRPSV